jgi:mannose-6-phosphate isomerase-like protein (cupin superfamily)
MKTALFAALLLGAIATPAFADEPFRHVSPDEAKQLTAKLVDHIGSNFLYRKDSYQQEIIYRDASGVPEVHANWADHFVVTEGEATLIVGGTVVNEKETGPGEKRGTAITGGKEYQMVPGVIITVPAGMPHWTVLKPGAHLRAAVFKLKD